MYKRMCLGEYDGREQSCLWYLKRLSWSMKTPVPTLRYADNPNAS